MPNIALTKGYFAIVDEDNLKFLSLYKWCVVVRSPTLIHVMKKYHGYTIYMHHMVIGSPIKPLQIDHINGNGLDNRRENLRIVSPRENALNSSRSRNALVIESHGRKFRVRPYVNGIRVNLGSYNSYEEAISVLKEHRNV